MLRNILLKNKESSPELLSRVIRLQVELTKPDNNIFSFPDLCKEAGIELPNPHSSHYPSTSESDSESLEFSDNETNDNNNESFESPQTSPSSSSPNQPLQPPPDFDDSGNDFFKRILENSEKYA